LGLGFLILSILIITRLHLRLLNQHLFLDLIDFLLLFNLHLIDHPPVFLPELLDVKHQLLICLLTFLECVLEPTALLLKSLVGKLLLLKFLREELFYCLVITFLKEEF
jgi:hypothetical protein